MQKYSWQRDDKKDVLWFNSPLIAKWIYFYLAYLKHDPAKKSDVAPNPFLTVIFLVPLKALPVCNR